MVDYMNALGTCPKCGKFRGWADGPPHKCAEVKEEGKKNDNNKPRYDLFPPDALELVADVFKVGSVKYGDRNWEKGMAWGRVFRAMMSHAWKWWRGETYDQEDGQHHLSSVVWCGLVLLAYDLRKLGTDDRNKL